MVSDGAVLTLRRFVPAGQTRAVVLALHGFEDHAGNFLLDSLAPFREAGLQLYAYDQRGFGAAPNGAFGLERPCWQRTPLKRPNCCADAMTPMMRGTLWIAGRLLAMMGAQGGTCGTVTGDNPDALCWLGRDPLVIRTTRIDAAFVLMELMDAAAQDMIVPARASRHALRPLPGAVQPQIAVYPQGFHLLLADRNREEVARDILTFIKAPAAPLPSGAEANAPAWLEGRLTPGS